MVGEADPALAGLPEPGDPVFYPKVGHCIYRGVTEDRVAPGMRLLELEDFDEDSRILIPLARVPELKLRPAGLALEDIKEILSAEFEEPIESEDERHDLVEELIADGSPRALAQALKRLHLIRQTSDLSREEELTRKKVRSWLAGRSRYLQGVHPRGGSSVHHARASGLHGGAPPEGERGGQGTAPGSQGTEKGCPGAGAGGGRGVRGAR